MKRRDPGNEVGAIIRDGDRKREGVGEGSGVVHANSNFQFGDIVNFPLLRARVYSALLKLYNC